MSYSMDAADRPTAVTTKKGATTTTLASGIAHKPYGGIASMTYGNGLPRTVSYDQQYRITGIQTGAVQNASYTHDPNGNITAITNNLNPTKNKAFAYDALDRLTSATGPWGSLGWTYDGVGNRLTQVENGATSNYSYQPGTNRLESVTGPSPLSFALDANGNTTQENAKTYTFNQNNRLIKAADSGTTKGQYTYNANGQRATKIAGGIGKVFHYDQSGNLLSETSLSGGAIAEYVHLEGQPIAKLDSGGTRYVHPDHLGTPQIMTNATKAVVWQIEARPFGDGASITGTASLNLRFPGQYYDQETGLHQNWHRDYMPGVGRYIEGDPLGQRGGGNPYLYAGAHPARFVDRKGLLCIDMPLLTIPTGRDEVGRDIVDVSPWKLLTFRVQLNQSPGLRAVIRGRPSLLMMAPSGMVYCYATRTITEEIRYVEKGLEIGIRACQFCGTWEYSTYARDVVLGRDSERHTRVDQTSAQFPIPGVAQGFGELRCLTWINTLNL